MQRILRWRLEIVAFVSGAVLMTVELVGSRILSPYLGVSTFVWTSIIGVILGFLSLGYWYGGRLSLKDPNIRTLSKILFLSFLCISAILFAEPFLIIFRLGSSNIRLMAVIGSMILFGPMAFCLGMVSPYVARLRIESTITSGSTIENLYAISTLGSILGTFLGGFVLISFLGTSHIIFFSSFILFVIFVFISFQNLPKEMFFFGIIVLMVSSFLLRSTMGAVADIDTLYNRWVIVDSKNEKGEEVRYLSNNIIGIQSAIYKDRPTELVFPYLEAFDVIPDTMMAQKKVGNVLLVGAGAFTYPTHFASKYADIKMDIVEIDLELQKISEEFFQFKDTPQFSIYGTDARIFLNGKENRYDIVFIDAFSSELSVPHHLTTVETVRDLKKSLADDGVVVVNIISAIRGKNSKFASAVYNTYSKVFPYVYVFSDPLRGEEEIQNLVFMASNTEDYFDINVISSKIASPWKILDGGVFDQNIPILTDDFAPVESYISGFLTYLTNI